MKGRKPAYLKASRIIWDQLPECRSGFPSQVSWVRVPSSAWLVCGANVYSLDALALFRGQLLARTLGKA